MQLNHLLITLSVLAPLVAGHARIKFPVPFGAPPDGPAGNSYNAPLSADGSQFPCKGLHKSPSVDKKPTATWAAGGPAHFEILGHGGTGGEGSLASHSGGSCQASLSYDGGVTWKAIHSFEGGCPRGVALGSNMATSSNQTFPFEIPADAKASKDVLFAWTWTAVSGNRDEYYMNCAAVEITGSGTSTLDSLPDMWVGDQRVGTIKEGECASTAGNALKYPNPGEKVTVEEVTGIPFKESTKGNCVAPGSNGAAPGAGSSAPTVPKSSSVPAVSSATSSAPATYPPIASKSSTLSYAAPGVSTIAPPSGFSSALATPAAPSSAAPSGQKGPTPTGTDVSAIQLSVNGQQCACVCT